MLPYYQPSETELLICDLYQAFGIEHAHELDIDLISTIWGVDIIYYDGKPCSHWDDEINIILLNALDTSEQQRADFFHELCHIAKHEGNQDDLPDLFVELQEIQAAHFQLIAAMPYYLLPAPLGERCCCWNEYIGLLAETFRVPIELAVRRAGHIESRFHREWFFYKNIMKLPITS